MPPMHYTESAWVKGIPSFDRQDKPSVCQVVQLCQAAHQMFIQNSYPSEYVQGGLLVYSEFERGVVVCVCSSSSWWVVVVVGSR